MNVRRALAGLLVLLSAGIGIITNLLTDGVAVPPDWVTGLAAALVAAIAGAAFVAMILERDGPATTQKESLGLPVRTNRTRLRTAGHCGLSTWQRHPPIPCMRVLRSHRSDSLVSPRTTLVGVFYFRHHWCYTDLPSDGRSCRYCHFLASYMRFAHWRR